MIIKKHTNKDKTYFNKPKGIIPIFQYPRTGNEIFNEKSITQPLDRFNRKKNKLSNTWTEPIARKTNCPTLGQNQSQEKQTVQHLDRTNRKKNKLSNTEKKHPPSNFFGRKLVYFPFLSEIAEVTLNYKSNSYENYFFDVSLFSGTNQ